MTWKVDLIRGKKLMYQMQQRCRPSHSWRKS